MRIERVSDDQFTIFLTFDDLIERGFTKEDIWHDVESVRDLFSDMMQEASLELGLELEGVLLVQVHLMQAQGMHVFVTQKSDEEDDWYDEFIEMKVTLDESKELIFAFKEFEHIIQVTSYLDNLEILGGQVYLMDGIYYMNLLEEDLNEQGRENIIAILSEFGTPSIVTSYRLQEYGKVIIEKDSVKTIQTYFK